MNPPLNAKEVADKIFSHIVNLLDLTMGEVREPLHTMVRDSIATALESYAEEKVREKTRYLHGTVEMSIREQARAEAIEEAAKVAEVQPMVKRDNHDYYCACSVAIADKIRALAKCRERGMNG